MSLTNSVCIVTWDLPLSNELLLLLCDPELEEPPLEEPPFEPPEPELVLDDLSLEIFPT